MRTLIVYATDEGQTEKIASRIAERLRSDGFPSDEYNIAADPDDPIALDAYDAVMVGSPMHYSHYDQRLADYLTDFKDVLREVPSAFFSVSLGILSDDESEKNEVRQITDAYLAETGWAPSLKIHFGGALKYSKYGWLKRHMMKLIARKGGGPSDDRFDYEFTDWIRVDEFTDQFVEFVKTCEQPEKEYSAHSLYSKPTRRYSIKNRRVTGV